MSAAIPQTEKERALRAALPSFTGSECFYRYSGLFARVLLTEGTLYLAEQAGAFWLMDAIASHLPAVPTSEGMVFAVLDVDDDKAVLRLVDDVPPRRVYAKQEIEYTDFPIKGTTQVWAQRNSEGWTLMLPSEY